MANVHASRTGEALDVTVILVRHGHVDGISPARFRGRADLALSALGQAQAEALAQRLAQTRTTVVYSSPLRRSMQTAEAIARHLSLTVLPVEGFADIDYGAWQGLSVERTAERWPEELMRWYRAPHLAEIPDGETLAEVGARCTKPFNHLVRLHAGETIVIVGHDTVNRVLLLHALDLPLSAYWRVRQDPCCYNEILVCGDRFTAGALNDTGHLAQGRGAAT